MAKSVFQIHGITANEVIRNLSEQLMALHQRIRWYEERLKQVAKEDARVRLLRRIPGVGAVTASAIIASIGDRHQFRNGREFAAWLGLTPANKSSGGKEKPDPTLSVPANG